MKLIAQLFLSFIFFLLGGYNSSWAASHHELHSYCVSHPTPKLSVRGISPGFSIAAPTASFSLLVKEKQEELVYTEETDDRDIEIPIAVRPIADNNYFSAFYSPTSIYLLKQIKRRPSFCEHFSSLPERRYIRFLTIRI